MISINYLLTSLMTILYACGLMYLLLDVKWGNLTKKTKQIGVIFFFGFLILNLVAQIFFGYELYGKFYLLLTQFPVYILFRIISEYKGIKLLFVLLTTVFFCSPVLVIISIVNIYMIPPVWIYTICYIGFILLISRFLKKAFNDMLRFGDNRLFLLFTTIPLLFYIYTYALTGYQMQDLIVNQRYFIFQIPLLIVVMAYLLLGQIFKMISDKAELKNAQNLSNAQLSAATEQIEQLRIAERQSAIYRHDLRHHMNYLNTCITQNKLQEATNYIQQTCADVDTITLKRYSEHEAINLILSYYVGKAKGKDIQIEVNVTATDFSRFHSMDLCSLLSNALENAIKASSQADDSSQRYIKLRLFEKNNKLCMELCNGYLTQPIFENKIPVSQKDGHGIGVKSMIHVVEKYEGVYKFSANDGDFSFQMSM
ncbi:MAG: GHKL domain-containing protein [Erysipelotrichaceae bacterium]